MVLMHFAASNLRCVGGVHAQQAVQEDQRYGAARHERKARKRSLHRHTLAVSVFSQDTLVANKGLAGSAGDITMRTMVEFWPTRRTAGPHAKANQRSSRRSNTMLLLWHKLPPQWALCEHTLTRSSRFPVTTSRSLALLKELAIRILRTATRHQRVVVAELQRSGAMMAPMEVSAGRRFRAHTHHGSLRRDYRSVNRKLVRMILTWLHNQENAPERFCFESFGLCT